MDHSYFIGVDVGTQGVRVGISDENGSMRTVHESLYKTSYPRFGWAEQHPDDWWNGFIAALSKCLSDVPVQVRTAIRTLGVCGTSSTVLAIDSQGNPLGDALLWMDSRATEETAAINATKDEVLKYCGGEVSVEWMIPKTLWIKHHEPDLYAKAYKILEQVDFFNYRLTGVCCSSINIVTCKWNYVADRGGWDSGFFKRIGLEDYQEKIPTDVRKVGQLVGKIDPVLAQRFGLSPELQVIQGATDACEATFGNGVVEPRSLATIMGTSFVHQAVTADPIFQKGIWGPFNKALTDDYWMLEGGQISAGSIVGWLRDEFDITEPFSEFNRKAAEIPVGSDGLVILDFFAGNRTPYKNPKLKGVIYGLRLNHTKYHVYRAVMESVAFGTKNIIENFAGQGYQIDRIVGSGGATKNEVWLQIMADVTGKTITVNTCTDAGVLGHGVVGAVASGVYPDLRTAVDHMIHPARTYTPDPHNAAVYDALFKKYLSLYESLKDLMNSEEN
jgi:ribulokinase